MTEAFHLLILSRKLHSERIIGKVGDYLIELAACWGLVLLTTPDYICVYRVVAPFGVRSYRTGKIGQSRWCSLPFQVSCFPW